MSESITTTASAATLAALGSEFPQEANYNDTVLPRLTFKSQDVMEGKGKSKKVVIEAGTFLVEEETEEIDPETGKKVWEKTELGQEVKGVHIIFQRKQLRYFDESTELYTSSPVYDSEDEVVPLFCDKKKIAEGLPKDLKALYQYTTEEGKVRSRLEENRILYVLIDGKLHQLTLRGSSMYSFLTFARNNQANGMIVTLSSTAEERGSIEWNQMSFVPERAVTEEEAVAAIEMIEEIKQSIQERKEFYASYQIGDASAVTTGDGVKRLAAGKDDDDF